MKTSLLCLAIILLAGTGFAQIVDWQWANHISTNYSEYSSDMVTDNSGNSYVTGYFYQTVNIGPFTLTSQGSQDIYIAKTDAAGNWLWAIRAGGAGAETPLKLALDDSGNLYLSGYFDGAAVFGSSTLNCAGVYDLFVAKLSSSGTWQWATRAGGTLYDTAECLALDSAGNIYVGGYFEIAASFGSTNLTSAGGNDLYVAKLNSSGSWQWAKRGGGPGYDLVTSISVDGSGNCYATGTYRGTSSFGTTNLTCPGSQDLFVIKLSSSGNWLWAKGTGTTTWAYNTGIVTDSGGNSFLAGMFAGSVTLGSQTLVSAGSADILVGKIDSDGNWLWSTKAGGSSTDRGDFITLDNFGNILVAGYFYGTADIAGTTLISNGQMDVFVAKLSGTGDWKWSRQAGGSSYDYCSGLTYVNGGHIIISGFFQNSITIGNQTLHNPTTGYTDVFVAGLQETALPLAPQNPVITRVGNDLVLNWDATSLDTNGQTIVPNGYTVYWRDSVTGIHQTVQTQSNTWTHTDAALQPIRLYHITAVKEN